MRICIFGAGSLGSALGGLLSAKHDVVLVGRRPHMTAVKEHGLRLVGDLDMTASVEARVKPARDDSPDLLIISTKAYDTAKAIAESRAFLSDGGMVLTLQNGLGNLDLLRAWKGRRAFGGTTTMGAALVSPGVVRVSGSGVTTLGADEDPEGAKEISKAFSYCGIPSRTVSDISSEIWSKAAVSASINPLTAVLRVQNGRLLESPIIARLMSDVCRECVSVAASDGIALSPRATVARARAVAKNTARNRSSMLQDVELGRRTEIDQINGAFWSIGRRRGISTPLNATLAATVRMLERRPSTQKG